MCGGPSQTHSSEWDFSICSCYKTGSLDNFVCIPVCYLLLQTFEMLYGWNAARHIFKQFYLLAICDVILLLVFFGERNLNRQGERYNCPKLARKSREITLANYSVLTSRGQNIQYFLQLMNLLIDEETYL